MTKTELESKHLSDLHQVAAAAGVERFRMLSRAELIERLSDGNGDEGGSASRGAGSEEGRERPRRRRRRSGASAREREEMADVEEEEEKLPESRIPERAPAPAKRDRDRGRDAEDSDKDKDSDEDGEGSRPRRRRRRRPPFGRRKEGISIQDLLLPAESGRQAVLIAESREAATDLLRGVAADLAESDDGPDPVALLIDPSPEE